MSTCTSVLAFVPIPFCLFFFRSLEPPLLSDAYFLLVLVFSFRRWVNASSCWRVRVRVHRHEFGAAVEAQPCTMCLLGSRPPSVGHPSRSIAFVRPTLEKGGRGGKTRKVQREGAPHVVRKPRSTPPCDATWPQMASAPRPFPRDTAVTVGVQLTAPSQGDESVCSRLFFSI